MLSASLPAAEHWGAAHTRSRCEKQVAAYLRNLGVPVFLPLVRRRNLSKRQVRHFHVPLFPCYVFFDTAAIDGQGVFNCRRVANILETHDQTTFRAELETLASVLSRRADGSNRSDGRSWGDPFASPVEVWRVCAAKSSASTMRRDW